jgi:hypothetical protein
MDVICPESMSFATTSVIAHLALSYQSEECSLQIILSLPQLTGENAISQLTKLKDRPVTSVQKKKSKVKWKERRTDY